MGKREAARPVLAAAALLVGASAARAEPAATCTARAVEGRVLAEVELRDFFDDETVRLMRLGLQGRLRVEATVLRKRWLFAQQRVAEEALDQTVSISSADGRLLLDGRPDVRDPARLSLGRIAIPMDRPPPAGATLEVRVRLQVITATTLGDVASWVTGRKKEEVGSSLERGVVAAVVDGLARRATASCVVGAGGGP